MITPYVRTQQGNWSLPETTMLGIFNHMQLLELDDTVFANGTIDNPLAWMQFVQDKRNVVHVVHDETTQQIAWLNSFGCNYAFAHFCCFPSSWGRNTVEVGRESLKYWFNDLKSSGFELDVILGQVPATNKRAIEYVKKLGLIELGTVPMIKYKNSGEAIGSFFCYITRKDI